MKKKKILIAGAIVGVMFIAAFVVSSIRLYLIEKKMPSLQDVYFTAYETSKGDTVLYKYDVQKGKTEVAARIKGYLRNYEWFIIYRPELPEGAFIVDGGKNISIRRDNGLVRIEY